LRAFIAVEIPGLILEGIAELINEMRKFQTEGINYVRVENIHVTLKFLGEFDDNDIESFCGDLSKIVWKANRVETLSIGGFPDLKDPRVLWIGLKDNPGLFALRTSIEDVCRNFGILPDDKEFKPHLTIARIKGKMNYRLANFLEQYPQDSFGSFLPKRFHLFQSKLTSAGPEYRIIRSF